MIPIVSDFSSLKVRCEYVPGERKCRRCQTKNLPCRPRERKKRKPAECVQDLAYDFNIHSIVNPFHSTHEQLQEKAYEKDRTIQRLLLHYDELRAEQKIREWMTRTSTSSQGRDVKGKVVVR